MPENDQLLKAVLDKPDDDAPRLAYADWCAQQGDPATKDRGEFVRAQIGLVKLMDPRQENQLNYVTQKLLVLRGPDWGRPLAPLTERYQFDRGFVELISMSARQFLERAPRIFALAPVRHLILTDLMGVIHDLFDSPYLRNIRSLELDRRGLGDKEIAILADSPHLTELRWLSLSYNKIGEAGVCAIASSPHLKKLAYVNLAGNLVEPNEEYSYDNGYVVDSGLTADGLRLEKRLGHLPWLHHKAKTIMDSFPNRFRIAALELIPNQS